MQRRDNVMLHNSSNRRRPDVETMVSIAFSTELTSFQLYTAEEV
jgi:hypothetical protein